MNAGGRGAPPLEALDVTGNLVFAGNGYVINKTKVNPYEGLDVKGKIIVVAGLPAELAAAAGGGRGRGGRGGADTATPAAPDTAAGAAPAAAANAPGGAPVNPLGDACTDFLTPEQYAAKNGALAVVTIANFQQLTAMSNPNAAAGFGGFGGGGGGGRAGLNGPTYQAPKLQAAQTCASVPSVTAGLAMTNSIFQGEKQSAQQIFYAAGSNAKQDSFELTASKKISLKVAVKSDSNHGENIIGILEGSDPVLKNEYVVISAHLDHIGLPHRCPTGTTSTTEPTTMAPVPPVCWPSRVIRGRRGQGNQAQAQYRLFVDGGRRERSAGARSTSPNIRPRSDQNRRRPEYGHDRPHQGPGFTDPDATTSW